MILKSFHKAMHLCISSLSSRANVVSKDGAVIICWHPKQHIPYEKTKPLPRNLDALIETDSPLKVQFDRAARPTLQEVASALCKSPRTIKPRRTERSFSPYHWENASRRRL